MSLVRYGNNVFDIDDVAGLELYTADDNNNVRVVVDDGETSFKIWFDTANEAETCFKTLCEELEVRDLTPNVPETAAAE